MNFVNNIKQRKSNIFNKVLITTLYSFVLLIVISSILNNMFEKMTFNTISELNNEFAVRMDHLNESVDKAIVNYGNQLFYSYPIKKLMKEDNLNNTDRVYLMRQVNTALSSSYIAEDILILNEHNNLIYSTSPSNPVQHIDSFKEHGLKEILLSNDKNNRFKPLYCQEGFESDDDCYAFSFYEVNKDNTKKPGVLIVTIKASKYQDAIMASTRLDDLVIFDQHAKPFLSNQTLNKNRFKEYYNQIQTFENNSGYILDKYKKEICMYYTSFNTEHTYVRICDLNTLLPAYIKYKHNFVYFVVFLFILLLIMIIYLIIYTFIPMNYMETAIDKINELQDSSESKNPDLIHFVDHVVSKSEQQHRERLLSDMIESKIPMDETLLFESNNNTYAMMLLGGNGRKHIYKVINEIDFPITNIIITKQFHMYVVLGIFKNSEQVEDLAKLLFQTFSRNIYCTPLFKDIYSVNQHLNNLQELHKLIPLTGNTPTIIDENELAKYTTKEVTSTKDFTELIIKIKTSNYETAKCKWDEMMQEISLCRYNQLTYFISRTNKTLNRILKEANPNSVSSNTVLQLKNVDEITTMEEFNQSSLEAIRILCNIYTKNKQNKYEELCKTIKNIIESNYQDKNLTANDIADKLHMNSTYLGRIFRKTYNFSIADYINQCRIDKSKELLLSTDLPIEAIANDVGFANVKYFYVLFKKYVNSTPANYRTSNQYNITI